MKLAISHCLLILIAFLLSHHFVIAQTGNYFSGISAGASNTTGDYNSFAGYGAGVNNTAGSLNTAFGFYAGASNQVTSYNTSVGAYAGYFTSSSFGENVFVGYRAGFYNSNGFYNVFLGSNAGYLNGSGAYNVIIGAGAGYDTSSGLSNTFIGYSSGANNTTASANTFIGNLSGFSNTTGNRNTFVGSASGQGVSTSINNAFFGCESGKAVTTGAGNTMVGSLAGQRTTTGNHNVLIGLAAGENNTTGRENTFIGRVAGLGNTTGYQNSSLGFFAGPGAANLINATAIGYRAVVRVSNAIVLGSVSGQNGAASTVRVGIGTNSPGYLLHVNGVAAKPGGGSWTVASDKRLKQEITPYKEGLTQVMEINPVWFRYNGKAGLPTEKKHVGVIAQDMQKIAPHTVSEFVYVDSLGKEEKYLDYDANAMAFMLVNAVKELKTEFQDQMEQKNIQIQELQKQLVDLRKQLGLSEPADTGTEYLGQNYPNPYTRSTIIPYFVPDASASAELKIYSIAGQEVYSLQIMEKGKGEIEISNPALSAGNYIYHLLIDGKSVAHKRMALTK
jgi:trimeric autotransporter adhesin